MAFGSAPRTEWTTPAGAALRRWMDRDLRRIAAVEDGREYGFGDLAVGAARFAKALRASGVGPGVLVCLSHPGNVLHYLLILGCQAVGAPSVSLAPEECVPGEPFLARCGFLCAREPPAGWTGGFLPLDQESVDRIFALRLSGADIDAIARVPDDDETLRFAATSGTTGARRAVAMTEDGLRWLRVMTALDLGPPGLPWDTINVYGMTLRSAMAEAEAAWRRGARVVHATMDGLPAAMRALGRFRLTLLARDAALLARALPADFPGPLDALLHVKGGAMDPRLRADLEARAARTVAHTYGASEFYRLAAIGADGRGTLVPHAEARIVGPDRTLLPSGRTGLIEARTPVLGDGYAWSDDAGAFRDGWFLTNDLGEMPDGRTLVVRGRADDIVVLGGIKFAPEPHEAAIAALPAVGAAAIVAAPDAVGRDVLHVFAEAPPTAARAIAAALPPEFGPPAVHCVRALPRTATGKVRRAELRRRVGA